MSIFEHLISDWPKWKSWRKDKTWDQRNWKFKTTKKKGERWLGAEVPGQKLCGRSEE